MRSRTLRRYVLIGSAAVAGAASVALVGASSAAGSGDDRIRVSEKSLSDFPRNANGMTFGSSLEARTPADEPDLIASWGTKGELGYVRTSDMQGVQPRTPAEAIALTEKRMTEGPTAIPLYAEDGPTVIGEFILG